MKKMFAFIVVVFVMLFITAQAAEEGIRAQVTKVDLENKLVTIETEDGDLFKYRANGEIDAFRLRIEIKNGKIINASPEIAVKATLVGFDIAVSCYKLLTEEGEVELFELNTGVYNIGDEYIVYYADNFKPICVKKP